ncbi:NAD(P)-binding domain-containing protein [Brevundimonas sp.]|uniref:NADPH-dependent F420 reductase n=1 Tax=Brevundimonas sp. TaxID=1871086 RepID=UPI0026146110|nr:NAD(P)-binding domain-containing protein [Brevundimonas sp.]
MRLGIIGAGNIGGTLGRHWVKAGHEVMFGVRSPQALQPLLQEFGARAHGGSGLDAAAFGDAVVFAGPYGAWPDVARENLAALSGKVVVDAANPYPARDGSIAEAVAAMGRGSGAYTASLVPGARLVKAFNTVYWVDLRDEAGRPGERLAMPIAGDDADALSLVGVLADDAGFDPVIVGGLDESGALDPGSAIYAKSMTAAGVRAALGLAS